MTENEIIAILRLQSAKNVGSITAKKLIQHCGSPTAIFTDKVQHLSRVHGIGSTLIKELKAPSHLIKAEKELRFLQKEKINITYFEEEKYPNFLKHCIDAPIVLFSRGK